MIKNNSYDKICIENNYAERSDTMIMKLAIEEARKTMNQDMGGPFGALIVKDDKVISVSSNTVLGTHDPTAHAEINAIRKAGKVLNTHDLTGCKLYVTGYPCPMCLSAIIWANIKEVYYGTTLKDAESIGFRDDFIYNFIRNNNSGEVLTIKNIEREECIKLFEEYKQMGKEIY